MMFRLALSVVAVCFAFSLAGCGGQASTVSGMVTLDGEPLTKGTVDFHPRQPGPTVSGQIDGSGKYTLATGTEQGLAAGEYDVTVEATEFPAAKDPKKEVLPVLLTPENYRSKEKSGLSASVKPGHNDVPLTLESKGKGKKR